MINDIYKSVLLKHPLSEIETNLIEKVWDFIKIFKKTFLYISDYRSYLIKKIKKKYTIEQFFIYETIVNKMFWNLRWILAPLFLNKNLNQEEYFRKYNNLKEIPNSLLLCKKITYINKSDLKIKLKNINLLLNNFYRSFINKLIFVDKKNKVIYSKEMEGSSEIFSKNYFNLYTITILFNRNLYEKIMSYPIIIQLEKIKISHFYNQSDYGFPNLNFCVYNFANDKNKIKRIEKMYYSNLDAKYWFRLIL